jgi:hypothetical protein
VGEKETRQDDAGNGRPRNQKEFMTRGAGLILRWSVFPNPSHRREAAGAYAFWVHGPRSARIS